MHFICIFFLQQAKKYNPYSKKILNIFRAENEAEEMKKFQF